MGQLQMYAACNDPQVRDCARDGFRELYQFVERSSGAPAEELAKFFAMGMLCNLSAALSLGRNRRAVGERARCLTRAGPALAHSLFICPSR